MYYLLLYKTAVLRSLVSILEAEGITVTTAAAVEIEKILANTDSDKLQPLSDLKYLLAPLLCRNKEDQDKVYKAFEELDEKVAKTYTRTEQPDKEHDDVQAVAVSEKENEKTSGDFYFRKILAPAAVLLAVVAGILFYLLRSDDQPQPPDKKFRIAVKGRQPVLVGDTVVLTAVVDSSMAKQDIRVDWRLSDTTVQDTTAVTKIIKDTAAITAIAFLKNANGVAIDADTLTIQASCEQPPSVAIDEIDLAAGNLKTASNKKQFRPLFTNPAKDSAGYTYRWLVDGSLRSREKVFRYSEPYTTVNLVVGCKGIHCSADSLVAQVESVPTLNTKVTGNGPLDIQSSLNTRNILISLLLLVLLPAAVSFLSYRIVLSLKAYLPEVKEVIPDETGPFDIEFTSQQQYIHSEQGIKKLADVLRKRQVSDVYKLDLRKTIRSTVVAGGIPQLAFAPLSKPLSFLVFIDTEKKESHLVKLFEYLAGELHKEQVDVYVYKYFKEPLFLSNDKLNQKNIPLKKLAGLYPDSTLLIFGDAQYFLYPLKGKIKDWVTKKLSDWKTKILITPFVAEDWDKKEKLLTELNFSVLPADLSSAHMIDQIVSRQIDVVAQKKQHISSPYRSRFINFQDFGALKHYLSEDYLLQWVCSLAVYPDIDWNFTIAIGNAIERQLEQSGRQVQLVNYTNLLKLSRISWMQDGIVNESLRVDMLAYLDKDSQALARETLEKQLQSIEYSIADNSLVKEKFDIHKKLNRFLLDVYHRRKTRKSDESYVRRILEQNRLDEAQDIYLNEGENGLLWNPRAKHKEVSLKDYFKQRSYAQKLFSGMVAALMMVLSIGTAYFLLRQHTDFLRWSTVKPVRQAYTVSTEYSGFYKRVNFDLYYEPTHTKWRSQTFYLNNDNFSFKYDTVFIPDTTGYGLIKLSTDEGKIIRQDSFKLNSASYAIKISVGEKTSLILYYNSASDEVLASTVEENLPANVSVYLRQQKMPDSIKSGVVYFSPQYRKDASLAASALGAALANRVIIPELADPDGYSVNMFIFINEKSLCTPTSLPGSVNEIWHGGTSNRLVNIDLKRNVIYYSTGDPKTYGSYAIYNVCLTRTGAYKITTKANGGFNVFFIKNVKANSFDFSVCETIRNRTVKEIEAMDETSCNNFNTMTLYYEPDKDKVFYPVQSNAPLIKSEQDKLNALNPYSDITFTHYEGMHGYPISLSGKLLAKKATYLASGGSISIVNPTPFQRDYDVVTEGNNSLAKKYTILWIDDHPENNYQLMEQFAAKNIQIDTVTSNANAASLLRRGRKFDLVISDILRDTGSASGLDVKTLLGRYKVSAPLILFTDQAAKYKDSTQKLGAVLITNNSEELSEAVERLLIKPALPRSP